MGFTYFMLSLAATICTSTISCYLFRAFFRPSGWTRNDNYGVAVRFKVFLPLYLQKPEKWKLMPDKASYDNRMTVYFSSGLEWRKYNRWRKRAKKARLKREQEEREQRFHEMIFKDYQTEPNPEFTPPPTVKQKTEENGEDYFIVRGGTGNSIVAVLPKPGGELTNAECDKILADLLFSAYDPKKADAIIKQWANSKDWGINPMELAVQAAIEKHQAKKLNHGCGDCKHFMPQRSANNIRELCSKHQTGYCFMQPCGLFEPKSKRKVPLETVQTYPLKTTEHYE